MSAFDSFVGNTAVAASIRQMLAADRLPQTLLLLPSPATDSRVLRCAR